MNGTSSIVREAWTEYLTNLHWDFMFTSTFKAYYRGAARGPQTAISMVQNKLPRAAKSITFAESHRLGGFHCHGLIDAGRDFDLESVQGYTQRALQTLGFCRVERVNNVGAVSTYCAKYLTKACGDYDLQGDSRWWQRLDSNSTEGFSLKMGL